MSDQRRDGHSKLVYDKATRSIVTVDPNPVISEHRKPFRVRETYSYDGANHIVDGDEKTVDPQWIVDRLNAL